MAAVAPAKISDFVRCSGCGRFQLPGGGLRCYNCGTPLLSLRVYRRTWQGGWVPVEELDLRGSLPLAAPRPWMPVVQRWAALVVLASLPGLSLFGWSWKLSRQAALAKAQMVSYLSQGVGVIEVQLDAGVQRAPSGQLVISGTTNLPDGTVVAGRVLRGDTVLAEAFPIVVSHGTFQSLPLLNRGRGFEAGQYDVAVLARFSSISQPEQVFAIVGPEGRKLAGPLVASSADASPAKQVEFRQTIDLW